MAGVGSAEEVCRKERLPRVGGPHHQAFLPTFVCPFKGKGIHGGFSEETNRRTSMSLTKSILDICFYQKNYMILKVLSH